MVYCDPDHPKLAGVDTIFGNTTRKAIYCEGAYYGDYVWITFAPPSERKFQVCAYSVWAKTDSIIVEFELGQDSVAFRWLIIK